MILEFINRHKIVDIGVALTGEPFAEMILDSPYKFIDVTLKENYYISKINWWERANLQAGSQMGFGGPVDPRDPKHFFFSETNLCKEFSKRTTAKEYYKYIDNINAKYKDISLIPSFEIKYKDTFSRKN